MGGFRYKMYENFRQYTTLHCEVDEDTIEDMFADSNGNFEAFEEMVREHCYCNYEDDSYDRDYDDTDDYDNELSNGFYENLKEYFEQMKGERQEEDGAFIGEL